MLFAGKRIGDIVLTKPKGVEDGHLYWYGKCRCGNEKAFREKHLINGRTTTCGHCDYSNKHPLAHKSWDSMHQRCNNPNAPDYPRYGGRGIKIDLRWLRFADFLEDMGDPPFDVETGDRYTLERKDNNGNYCKENCIWASRTHQNNNRSNNVMIKRQPYKRKVDDYQ